MQNTMVQKYEFSKMQDCSGFLQIGSHITGNHYHGYTDTNIDRGNCYHGYTDTNIDRGNCYHGYADINSYRGTHMVT